MVAIVAAVNGVSFGDQIVNWFGGGANNIPAVVEK